MKFKTLPPLAVCGLSLFGGVLLATPQARAQAATSRPVPAEAKQEGKPVRDGERVLFRFHAPADAAKVFLAGSFNGWGNNENGAITDNQFALIPAGDGYFYTRTFVEPKVGQYKYVVLDKAGQFNWTPDPQVKDADQDGNSVLDFGKLARLAPSASRDGAPLRAGDEVLFRFTAPADATKVFLAGSFNGWGDNKDGAVTDEAFALTRDKSGLYSKRVVLGQTVEKYKYVVLDKDGKYTWVTDPNVQSTDADGNTTLDFARIERVP